jgi:hypothetical protein
MTGPSDGNATKEQALTRLAELQREYEVGQRRLQELVAQEMSIRETLLRISGAIQVLQELTGQAEPAGTATAVRPSPGSADPTGVDPTGVAPTGVAEDAGAPAAGTVLRVG